MVSPKLSARVWNFYQFGIVLLAPAKLRLIQTVVVGFEDGLCRPTNLKYKIEKERAQKVRAATLSCRKGRMSNR